MPCQWAVDGGNSESAPHNLYALVVGSCYPYLVLICISKYTLLDQFSHGFRGRNRPKAATSGATGELQLHHHAAGGIPRRLVAMVMVWSAVSPSPVFEQHSKKKSKTWVASSLQSKICCQLWCSHKQENIRKWEHNQRNKGMTNRQMCKQAFPNKGFLSCAARLPSYPQAYTEYGKSIERHQRADTLWCWIVNCRIISVEGF